MYCRYISLCCVIVLYLPWSKSIDISSSDEAIVGEEFTLSCTSGYNRVYWGRNNVLVGYSSTSNSNGCKLYDNYKAEYEFKSCGSEHKLTIKSINYTRDHTSTWRCAYYSIYRDKYIYSQEYTINVKVYLAGSEAVVLYGEEFILRCRTSVARTIRWYRNEVFIKDSDVNIYEACDFNTVSGYPYYQFKSCKTEHQLKFTINYNRDNDVIWKCGYWTAGSFVTSTYTINVSISPRLKIEYFNTNNQPILICTADGRPENTTFLPWKHYINTQLVREVTGDNISDSLFVLNMSDDLQRDQGTYICTASNGIINRTTGSVYQTSNYNLRTEVEPEIDDRNVSNQSESQVGRTFELNVTFISGSESDVTWYHGDMVLNQTERLSISQEGTNISHPYYTNINIPAITAVLTITSVATSDEGIYSSHVCNVIGCANTTFHLTVLELPVSMIPQSQEESTVNDQSTLIIAGSVGSACVIIICVVVVVVIVVTRKHRRPTKDVSNREFTSDRCKDNPVLFVNNTDLDKMEPIILENHLYISADVCTGDASTTVYVKVNKTNKQGSPTDETYAPVYGSVNKNKSTCTAGPVYGVVNKTPTTKAGKSRGKSKVTNTLFYNNVNNSSGQPVPVSDGRADGKHHRIKPLQDSNQNQICQSNVVYYNTSSEVVSCEDINPYVNRASPSTDANYNPNSTDADPYVNTRSPSTDSTPNPNPIDADPYVNTPLPNPT